MKPFREMNPIPIAVVGIVVLLVMLYGAFNAQNLPFIGGGPVYKADFSDAGGLVVNDDVRIAGVKVGQITSISLHGSVVQVSFRLNNGTWLGDQTTAAVKIKTLLGQNYLALDPEGGARLSTSQAIPLARTSTPLQITSAFEGLASHIANIDTTQLAKSFDTLSSAFANTPAQVHGALVGLARLSTTIASRDAELTTLLQHAQSVTAVLAARDAQVTQLIYDGDQVLQLVEQQRAVIHDLLVNSSALAIQMEGLVQDNKRVLGPALTNLESVTTILQNNQANLDQSIHLLAPFVRDFDNTLGNGRWFDTFVADLPILPGASVCNTPVTSGCVP